ncbi:MAG: ABC transporter ATP-binding protein [Planctomycetales bacterium]|nr:ABC transporter ATP-binding protein [Planctomycetales bacterium]MCA9170374.1 ABC transporter ATP-binding protein [Planctomycetales bacterium]
MEDNRVIYTEDLTRYFGQQAVVRNLNLAVPRGAVVGLLGLNGAGKTTTLRMLLGMLEPTRGHATVLGKDSRDLTPEDRGRIGFTGEGHFLYDWMSIRDTEKFGRDTFPRWDDRLFQETVDRFGIARLAHVRSLSRGQRAGVSLASTLATAPELLILDDPSLGLDPVSRRALNETLIDFCATRQRSVLLSTHMLDDVERVADRVAIIVDGRLLVNTSLDDLQSRVAIWSVDGTFDPTRAAHVPGLIHSRPLGGRWMLTVADPDAESEAAIARLSATAPQRVNASLEDIVLAYLSRSRAEHSFYAGAN